MANNIIQEPKEYNSELRKLEPTDPAHADTFNPLFKQLINNDAYLKEYVDESLEDNSKQVPHLGTTTNVGDAYSITTTQIINANQKFTIKLNIASTTAPTLKINTGSAYAVKKANGNNAKLYASVYTFFWDGSNFIQLGEGGDYGTATKDQVLNTHTIGTENGVIAGTIPIKSTQTYTPSTVNQTIASLQYLNGVQTILGDANLIAANIVKNKTIFDVVGAYDKTYGVNDVLPEDSLAVYTAEPTTLFSPSFARNSTSAKGIFVDSVGNTILVMTASVSKYDKNGNLVRTVIVTTDGGIQCCDMYNDILVLSYNTQVARFVCSMNMALDTTMTKNISSGGVNNNYNYANCITTYGTVILLGTSDLNSGNSGIACFSLATGAFQWYYVIGNINSIVVWGAYVYGVRNDLVQKITLSTGTYVAQFIPTINGATSAVQKGSYLYVRTNNNICKYNSSGSLVFAVTGRDITNVDKSNFAISPGEFIYTINDQEVNQVIKFSSQGVKSSSILTLDTNSYPLQALALTTDTQVVTISQTSTMYKLTKLKQNSGYKITQ